MDISLKLSSSAGDTTEVTTSHILIFFTPELARAAVSAWLIRTCGRIVDIMSRLGRWLAEAKANLLSIVVWLFMNTCRKKNICGALKNNLFMDFKWMRVLRSWILCFGIDLFMDYHPCQPYQPGQNGTWECWDCTKLVIPVEQYSNIT